ncbi:MAG TPA: ribonuclease III domain-containing protein [Planctomycetota bacterium]|nr:ribonuclease III domain-containing protein [Planctomycetota bacterium]
MHKHPPAEAAAQPPAPLELLAPLTRAEQSVAEALIGHRFSKPEWLALALTHSSATNASGLNNERIEFLGDSILGLVVAEHLVRTKPSAPEGELTRYRSMVVNTHTLAEVMRGMLAFMEEDEFQQVFGATGRGNEPIGPEGGSAHATHASHGVHGAHGSQGGHGSHSHEDGRTLRRVSMRSLLRLGRGIPANKELPSRIWANMFEAIAGAIYLDAGLDESRRFVMRMLEPMILSVTSPGIETNHKSLLQHITQKFLGGSVRYLVAGQSGPDHEKIFEIQVKVHDHLFDTAQGKSKREAEQAAALLALQALANDWGRFVINGMPRPSELLTYETSSVLSEVDEAEVEEAGKAPAYGLSIPGSEVKVGHALIVRDHHRRTPLVRLEPRSEPTETERAPASSDFLSAEIEGLEADTAAPKPAAGHKAAGARKKRRSRRKA